MSERELEPPRDAAIEATTPIAAANPAPQPPSDDATTTNTADGGPTQRSLQQASLALELALSRIVEVRRSLLQLAQSMPGGTPSDAPQDSDEPDLNLRAGVGVGPAHDAILLAGDAPLGGEQYGAGRPRRRHHPNARVRDSIGDAIEPSYSPSPASDAVARLTQRYDDMYAALMSADPAATTRGLRVAAREAQVGAPPTRETFAPGADFVLTPEYDEIRGVMSLGIRPPPPPPPAPLPRAPLPPVWRTNETPRWRRRALPMSLPPLPATSASTGAGAGAEAQPRLPSFADFIGGPPPPVPGLGPFPEESAAARFAERYRQYQEARNSGDDDAALDWADDDFFAWLFPAPRMPPPLSLPADAASNTSAAEAGGGAVRVTRTTETQVSPADRPTGPSTARRRGWGTSPPRVRYADTALTPPAPAVRLDADGNEVPPDEEREIERARTEFRMRALGHARRAGPGGAGAAGAGGAPNGPRMWVSQHRLLFPENDAPRAVQPTRGTEAPPDDSADVDMEMQIAATPAAMVRPLYVDPLPMPLAAMVADAQRPASPATRKAIAVPPHACLAGR